MEKTLTLRRGWNQVFFRGYCVGYPPFRVGLVLAGPAETLWTLRVTSTVPPEGELQTIRAAARITSRTAAGPMRCERTF